MADTVQPKPMDKLNRIIELNKFIYGADEIDEPIKYYMHLYYVQLAHSGYDWPL